MAGANALQPTKYIKKTMERLSAPFCYACFLFDRFNFF